MRQRRGRTEESGFMKALVLTTLLALTMLSTSVVLTAYPQHLYINNGTIINSDLKFVNNNSVNIKGHQVQYGQNDIIPVGEGRDYIKITGRQVQLGESFFMPGIRTITAGLYQSVIFEQKIGSFGIDKVGQISIDGNVINVIPASQNTVNVRTATSNYIVEFTQSNTYIKSGNAMLRLNKNGNVISIYLVGFSNYNRVLVRTI
ncbi:MAG: hypothetical protein OIN86_12940 [Candidatus Methanoperedens sp.]|nr:hypothetical protein [Candidatus Methanoperedens sp.]CAG0948604.1 hypothetical protein METP1_00041 [Methanosarcinales archaeon]